MTTSRPDQDDSRNPLLGITLILCAVFFFAGMDTATKTLSVRYAPPFVMAVRFALGLVLMMAFVYPRLGRRMITWRRPRIILARGVMMVTASVMAVYAFQRLPVAETVAIVYLAPSPVLFLAKPVLGERVSLSSWIASVGGFLGLVLIVRPGGGLAVDGVLFALASAAGATWYFLFTRMLASSEDTFALLFSLNIVGTIGLGATVPWTMPDFAPTRGDIGLFLYSGSAALIGHYLLTAAYREASAAVIAPLSYVHLIWAGLLGWVVFDHIPDPLATLGILLIAASSASLTLWTRIAGKRRMRPPAS